MNILPKPKKEVNGFTLVEVLMAMIILMFGILAVASMQVMAMRGNVHSKETTLRTTTADNIMEWLMGHDFDADNLRETVSGTMEHVLTVQNDGTYLMDDSDNSDGHIDTAPPENIIPPSSNSKNPINKIEWVVTADTGTKRITVTIYWEGGGQTQLSNIKPNMD